MGENADPSSPPQSRAIFGMSEGQTAREPYMQTPPQGQTWPVSSSVSGTANYGYASNQSGSGGINSNGADLQPQ